MTDKGADACAAVVANNIKLGVTWIHSYVTEDLKQTFCIYEGPTAEAIRETAGRNNLPIDRITPVSMLDPHFYKS
jgi:hypothetical protein